MRWTSEWINFRGMVRMVADDQTIHKGTVHSAMCSGDLPLMLIKCEDKKIRSVHPAHVFPLQEVK